MLLVKMGMKKGVHAGRYQLVFCPPELLIDSKCWRKMLSSPSIREG